MMENLRNWIQKTNKREFQSRIYVISWNSKWAKIWFINSINYRGKNVNKTALWTRQISEELFQGGNRAHKAEAERAPAPVIVQGHSRRSHPQLFLQYAVRYRGDSGDRVKNQSADKHGYKDYTKCAESNLFSIQCREVHQKFPNRLFSW